MTGLIYKATSPSGKVYVGQTVKSVEERKYMHEYAAFCLTNKSYNTRLSKAIRKYGSENFSWEIVESNIAFNLLNDKEIFYIKEYSSHTVGYNSTLGGQGVNGLSEESRKRIGEKASLALTGRKQDPVLVAKRASAGGVPHKGHKNYMFGKFGEQSPIAYQHITFELICETTIFCGFRRNETAKKLGFATSALSHRIKKKGFNNWKEFCAHLGGSDFVPKKQKRKPLSLETREKMSKSHQKRLKSKSEENKISE